MSETIPVGPVIQRNYYDLAESNPCHNCSAPCCRYMILSYNAPETLMAIDRMIYLLGIEMALGKFVNSTFQKQMIEF